MIELVVQPKQYRRLIAERRGIPISFVSSKFGRITITVPHSAVAAVLEVATSGKAAE
jgi:hypothetical protein